MTDRPEITQDMIRLYDEYTHLTLDRRNFIEKLTRLAGSSAAAAVIAPMLAASSAHAQVVSEDDSRLFTQEMDFSTRYGRVQGYMARPLRATAPVPGILVIHENRGLNAHIRDVTRRFALEGFVAVAPDFLSSSGGRTPADEDQAREMIAALPADRALNIAAGGVAHLAGRRETTRSVGAVGFCWGGGLVNRLAASTRELSAAVSFYGRVPEPRVASNIRVPILLHFAELDERINADILAFEEAMQSRGLNYTLHMYEGVNHAFHNDTSEARYDQAAAELAWERTIEFFRRTLN